MAWSQGDSAWSSPSPVRRGRDGLHAGRRRLVRLPLGSLRICCTADGRRPDSRTTDCLDTPSGGRSDVRFLTISLSHREISVPDISGPVSGRPYGELAAASGWARLDRSTRPDYFTSKHGCGCRAERAERVAEGLAGGSCLEVGVLDPSILKTDCPLRHDLNAALHAQ